MRDSRDHKSKRINVNVISSQMSLFLNSIVSLSWSKVHAPVGWLAVRWQERDLNLKDDYSALRGERCSPLYLRLASDPLGWCYKSSPGRGIVFSYLELISRPFSSPCQIRSLLTRVSRRFALSHRSYCWDFEYLCDWNGYETCWSLTDQSPFSVHSHSLGDQSNMICSTALIFFLIFIYVVSMLLF